MLATLIFVNTHIFFIVYNVKWIRVNLILLAKWVGTYSQCDWLPIFVLKIISGSKIKHSKAH